MASLLDTKGLQLNMQELSNVWPVSAGCKMITNDDKMDKKLQGPTTRNIYRTDRHFLLYVRQTFQHRGKLRPGRRLKAEAKNGINDQVEGVYDALGVCWEEGQCGDIQALTLQIESSGSAHHVTSLHKQTNTKTLTKKY